MKILTHVISCKRYVWWSDDQQTTHNATVLTVSSEETMGNHNVPDQGIMAIHIAYECKIIFSGVFQMTFRSVGFDILGKLVWWYHFLGQPLLSNE
jgi:hypothetical protein